MKNSGISIIIITHCREKQVKRCIDSVYEAIKGYDGNTEINSS